MKLHPHFCKKKQSSEEIRMFPLYVVEMQPPPPVCFCQVVKSIRLV